MQVQSISEVLFLRTKFENGMFSFWNNNPWLIISKISIIGITLFFKSGYGITAETQQIVGAQVREKDQCAQNVKIMACQTMQTNFWAVQEQW